MKRRKKIVLGSNGIFIKLDIRIAQGKLRGNCEFVIINVKKRTHLEEYMREKLIYSLLRKLQLPMDDGQ